MPIPLHASKGARARGAQDRRDTPLELPWQRRMTMMKEAALGMVYLHHMRPAIVHHDLKTENLLVKANWVVTVRRRARARTRNVRLAAECARTRARRWRTSA